MPYFFGFGLAIFWFWLCPRDLAEAKKSRPKSCRTTNFTFSFRRVESNKLYCKIYIFCLLTVDSCTVLSVASDVIKLCVDFDEWLLTVSAGYWPFGLGLCAAWQIVDVTMCNLLQQQQQQQLLLLQPLLLYYYYVTMCTSSIMHMCTVSMDRYAGIRDPIKVRVVLAVVLLVVEGYRGWLT